MQLPKRKPNRLQGYDYSRNGAYFITICIKEKVEILWNNVEQIRVCPENNVHLSEYGLIIKNEINKISEIYENNVVIDKYVVMPNHIHMIIFIENDGRPQVAPTISRIIQQFKGSVTKQIGFSIWQKLFHDHIIRNKQEYKMIWHYIDTNPQKWSEDCFYCKKSL